MSDEFKRHLQIGDWCFELKMVRALKVDEYGKPYQAIANCNVNGDSMYIDGLLTKEGEEFTKEDFMTFYKFTELLGLDNFSYHRYQNGESMTKEVKIKQKKAKDLPEQENNSPLIKLVK